MSIDTSSPKDALRGAIIVDSAGLIEGLNESAMATLSSQPLIGFPVVDALAQVVTQAALQDLSDAFGPPLSDTANRTGTLPGQLSVRREAFSDVDGKTRWMIMLSEARAMHPRRKLRWGTVGGIATLTAVSAAIYVIFFGSAPMQAAVASSGASPRPTAISAPSTLSAVTPSAMSMVSPQPASLSIIGTIQAANVVSVVAPFDGHVKSKRFTFDTEVQNGQPLLTIDEADLYQHIQEARVAMLKAEKTVRELEGWENGEEVSRAKRNHFQAGQLVDNTARKVKEAEMLLKKGIIARSEYDGLAEQLESQQAQLATAEADLDTARSKAAPHNKQIARIEHEQASRKFNELNASLAVGTILAPQSGIVARVPASSGQASTALDLGSRVSKGQPLLNIALTDRLSVSAKVDEADVLALAVGMPVKIVIDSQDMPPLQGRLAEISAQAVQSGNGLRSAVFEITVDLPPLSEQQRRHVRVGMSCNASIDMSASRKGG